MAKIVVLGSCSVDYAVYAPRLPQPGETLHGYKFATSYGGKGANQCVAAAKLSGITTMVARVGDDTWGDGYIKNMQDVGINTKYMFKTKNEQTGIAQITVSKTGENQIVIVEGANKHLSVEDVEKAKDVICEAAVIVCQLETPIEATIRAFELNKGIKILNAAPARPNLDSTLLSMTSVLCVNESEAATLTNRTVDTIQDAATALERLLRLGCETAIVTLGARGAMFASKTSPHAQHVRAASVRAVDTTGAGDAFVGTLAVLLAAGGVPLPRAVSASCYAASRSVSAEGTQTSFLVAPYECVLQRNDDAPHSI